MQDRELDTETNPHRLRAFEEEQAEPQEGPDRPSLRPDPLAQVRGRTGDANTAEAHAVTLNQATGGISASTGKPLLRLQRQYGNRYVQRVVAQARGEEGATDVPPEVEGAIQRKRGGGQALDNEVRGQMESAFGADFGGVRVHTDAEADTLNRAMNARAFTTGRDIFFRQGEHKPGSSSGRELLAHELTHVVQQSGGIRAKLTVRQPNDSYEQEADRVAHTVMCLQQEKGGDGTLQAGQKNLSPILQRKAETEEEKPVRSHRLVGEIEHTYERKDPWPSLFSKVLNWLRDNLGGVYFFAEFLRLQGTKSYPLVELTSTIVWCIQKYHNKYGLEFKNVNKYKLWLKVTPSIPLKVHWAYIQVIAGGPPGLFECAEESQEELTAGEAEEGKGPSAAEAKTAVEDMCDALDELDAWLEKWEFLEKKNSKAEKALQNLRKKIAKYRDPISKTLRTGEIVEESAKLAYKTITELVEHKPDSEKALKGLVKLTEPAGDFAKALSKVLPPGLSHLIEAVGEAVSRLPGLVSDVERAGDPAERMRERGRKDSVYLIR